MALQQQSQQQPYPASTWEEPVKRIKVDSDPIISKVCTHYVQIKVCPWISFLTLGQFFCVCLLGCFT